ncbi:MAG: hypothetical protein ACPKPY_05655, partial [Nitrososphaeraceae archaeon]
LFSIPPKKGNWHLQIGDKISSSSRPIDKMSLKEISHMYTSNEFVCDGCGKNLNKVNFSLYEHIMHLINPVRHWTCEDCFQYDLRNGKIIAIEEEKILDWQKEDK